MNHRVLPRLLPPAICSILLFTVMMNAILFGGARQTEQGLTLLLVSFAAMLWAIRLVVAADARVPANLTIGAVLLLLAYASARHFYADSEYVSRRELQQVWLAAMTWILVGANRPAGNQLERWLYPLAVLAAGISAYGIYQTFAEPGTVLWTNRPDQYENRASGTFINPNHFACFTGMVSVASLALVLRRTSSPTQRILLGYVFLLCLFALACSFSRGAWLAVALGVTWLVFARFRSHSLWIVLTTLVILLAVGGWSLGRTNQFEPRVELTARQLKDPFLEDRYMIWIAAYQVWREQPWFGVGADHFQYRFHPYRNPWLQRNPVRVHNDYLNTLCDYGVVGLATLSLVGGALIRQIRRSLPHVASSTKLPSTERALFLGSAAAAITLAAHSFWDFNFHIPAIALLGAYLTGLGIPAVGKDPLQFAIAASRVLRLLVGVVVASISALGLNQGWTSLHEARLLGQAATLPTLDLEAGRVRMAAAAWEPGNPQNLTEIGEHFRWRSNLGNSDYVELADEALDWHRRAHDQIPYSPWPMIHLGMTLDWIGQHEEAAVWFKKSFARDPNGQHTRAMMGWHFFQTGDYRRSLEYLRLALDTPHFSDRTAKFYYDLARERAIEQNQQRRRQDEISTGRSVSRPAEIPP